MYSLTEARQKSGVVYQHVYDAYAGEGRSIYAGEAGGEGAYRHW